MTTYKKPELTALGKASQVIESMNLKKARPSDGASDPQQSNSAYDLDE
jgi:hypothetical protein